jgi:alpha-galactosidase
VKLFKSVLFLVLGLSFSLAAMAADLSPTPPMGWNSWNAFNMGINESVIRKTADLIVNDGYRDAGYVYLNLDDGWQISRDEKGVIQADPQAFPSGMKALGDYIHSKGLKFGIYTCAGAETCGKRPGSKGHEKQDMATYASWGVDYIKVDWCSTDGLDSKKQYSLFHDGIRESGRPMVLSLCNWGVDQPWLWGKQMGQLWRTAGDLVTCWDCKKDWGGMGVIPDLVKQIGLESYAGPGGWNDPDMLQVGNSGLSVEEARSHFSIWCILAAPLLAGTNLTVIKPEFKEILLNKEAIDLDQDSLGKQGKRIKDLGKGREVWAKTLSDGTWAVCLFNRGEKSANVEVRWADLGFKDEKMKVRDLWSHRDLGDFNGGYTVSLPSHGVALLKLRDAKPTPLKASDTWRVRPGGMDFTDHAGRIWHEDIGFEGGQTVVTSQAVTAKEDVELYQTERWEADFSYAFPVLPGKYKVTLKFVETYLKEPGKRVFDILINGQKVKTGFDIFKEAGGFAKSVDLIFMDIKPDKDGKIQIRFVSTVQNAKVCAIEVVRQK